ncbi:class A beta-lactamase [Phenylobacterium sp. LjRoot225]|uniref:class A beta-lactamase n=1 Tax=Phenylobacterium sp. LjRoot225 TaxID=3342285 RepID=UPI003ECFBE33
MASLPRRQLLIGAGALTLAACRPRMASMTAARTPPLDMTRLNREVADIAVRVQPGVLGVGMTNLDSGEVFTFDGDRRFPLQSVFKAPLAAAVLAETDAGQLSLDEAFSLKPMDLSPPWSPVADAWPTRRDYTARQLLSLAVSRSDNTAADVLMARIGGPGVVTAWLDAKRIDDLRVDRYERELQTDMMGLASFRPAWKGEAAFQAALAAVPLAQQRQAMRTYLSDPRDTATPRGILSFLDMLNAGELLSPASTRLLLQVMAASPTGAARLKAGLPRGSTLAHKTGTGRANVGFTSAVNDVGIAVLPDKRRYSMAVFVAGATLSPAACEAVIADVARALVRGVR